MTFTLNPVLMKLLEEGVEVTITLNDSKQVVFNLNSGAKSEMHATVNEDGTLRVDLRYNEFRTVQDFDDMLMVANYARHGRDFMHPAWTALLQKTSNWY